MVKPREGLEASTPNQKNITASRSKETPLFINSTTVCFFSQGGKNG